LDNEFKKKENDPKQILLILLGLAATIAILYTAITLFTT
jgi:hypothetical protein